MSVSSPRISPVVLDAKEKLARGREKLRLQHDAGLLGVQVCVRNTELLEGIVLELFEQALQAAEESSSLPYRAQTVLIAHSGFGRREMAPHSDLDLMLLHPWSDEQSLPLVRPFTQSLYDLGVDLGFAARTARQAWQLAAGDATVVTSLTEARRLAGDEGQYNAWQADFQRSLRRHGRRLAPLVEAARRDERRQYGETNFLLEPNVKRSRGGLRDIQLVRWIGALRYGESDPEVLMQAGWLSVDDFRCLRAARDFLLWLRNDLHFHTGKANDLLERHEQLRLAERRGYPPVQGLLPVEQFMREYFQHTTAVREIAGNFVAAARPRSWTRWLVDPLFSHQVEGDFRVGPRSIFATHRGLQKLQTGVDQVLRLLELATLYDKRIDDDTWRAIRAAMAGRPPADPAQPLPEETARRFLNLLAQPAQLADSLRGLHNLRVLEQIVPAVSHARGLLQFNAYHYYTVDEHSLRAVDELSKLAQHPGTAGQVYRGIRDKRILHLAMLIHDLGKGLDGDHSEIGAEQARQLAQRLHLSEHDAEALVFLVLKHLRMSDIAQRHDIHDPAVLTPFAVEVGSPELLQMLYVLTIADLAAVGPGVLNDWKLELLTELYEHTLRLIASDSPADAYNESRERRREEVRAEAQRYDDPPWWRLQIDALPSACLYAGPAAQVVEELDRLRRLPKNESVAWGRYLPARDVAEYTIGAYEEITPGVFHKLTGALSSNRLQILSAEINTLAHGLVLDRFYVQDLDFAGPPPPERLESVSAALRRALTDPDSKAPSFRKLWHERGQAQADVVKHLPSRVTWDNATSDRFTILAVFAYDRLGLLYAVTRTLFELGLSVSIARIGTHLDQVVDVFYVTDHSGNKIDSDEQLSHIRRTLLAAIEQLQKG
jgi:[protein-PII] uridylyltransferase